MIIFFIYGIIIYIIKKFKFMNLKEKFYITLSFALVVFFIFADLYLYRYYRQVKTSPVLQMDISAVYEKYIDDLK